MIKNYLLVFPDSRNIYSDRHLIRMKISLQYKLKRKDILALETLLDKQHQSLFGLEGLPKHVIGSRFRPLSC